MSTNGNYTDYTVDGVNTYGLRCNGDDHLPTLFMPTKRFLSMTNPDRIHWAMTDPTGFAKFVKDLVTVSLFHHDTAEAADHTHELERRADYVNRAFDVPGQGALPSCRNGGGERGSVPPEGASQPKRTPL